MKNRIKIEKIGIEVELNKYFNKLRQEYPYHIKRFTKIPKSTIKAQLAPEFYDSQSEWKFLPIKNSPLLLDKVRQFILDNVRQGGRITGSSPEYVGTHFHFFLSNDNKVVDYRLSGAKLAIMSFVYKELYNWFYGLINGENKYDDEFLSLIVRELNRIIMNHNILRYFDQTICEDKLKANLRNYGMRYYLFDEGSSNPKHQPILWSSANEGGKPFSLELRILPNLFFVANSSKYMSKFIQTIENIINRNVGLSKRELINNNNEYVDSIVQTHNELIRLFIVAKQRLRYGDYN